MQEISKKMRGIFNALPRQMRLLILFLAIILAGVFVARFFFVESRTVPMEFLEARGQASIIAQGIVDLSHQTAERLREVAGLDNEKKYTEALILVSEELERNREAREKAVRLAVELEVMIKELSSISPSSASQKALEALTSETALISRLITYNDYLNRLLEVLRGKFLDRGDGNNIAELLGRINDEAKAINDLNKKFNDAMREFDAR